MPSSISNLKQTQNGMFSLEDSNQDDVIRIMLFGAIHEQLRRLFTDSGMIQFGDSFIQLPVGDKDIYSVDSLTSISCTLSIINSKLSIIVYISSKRLRPIHSKDFNSSIPIPG